MLETTEDKAALALVLIGFLILGVTGVMDAGALGAAVFLVVYGVYAVISVAAGIAAAFATAWLLNASFGLFGPAVLRLSGIIVFTAAIAVAVPFGGLLGLIVYVGLLMWLFELEPFEVFIFVVVLAGMRFLLAIVLAMMLAAAASAVL